MVFNPNSKANLAKPFEKGNVANPYGRPVIAPELRALRDLSKHEVLYALSRQLLMKRDALEQLTMNPDSTMAEMLVASVLMRAIKDGCPVRSQFLFNYVVGKPKQAPPHDSADEAAEDLLTEIDSIPSAKLIDILREHGTS